MADKILPLYEKVTILDIASEGKCVAKIDDYVIFVDKVVPGDVVDIQIFKKKKSFAEGKAVHFHELSPQRAEVFCSHFHTCGGCKWQNLAYTSQLAFKEKTVKDNFSGNKINFDEYNKEKLKQTEILRSADPLYKKYYKDKANQYFNIK
jgi:23S rRNA (uracil1939-C5)-methyltransferase